MEDNIDFNLFDSIENSIFSELLKIDINSVLPFFLFEDSFKKLLYALANGDGKINSIFNKIGVGETFGYEMIDELIAHNIVYIVDSREKSLKAFPKQMIKKELRTYKIEPKLYFTKPFYRFWFMFVEKNRDKYGNIDINRVLKDYKESGYRLSSLLFEQLSIELLKVDLKNRLKDAICSSFWDRYSEFDIYCQSKSCNIVGECKYRGKPITKIELIKLEFKIEQSSLTANYIALFSKNGFSHELHKLNRDNLLLYELKDFKKLLL